MSDKDDSQQQQNEHPRPINVQSVTIQIGKNKTVILSLTEARILRDTLNEFVTPVEKLYETIDWSRYTQRTVPYIIDNTKDSPDPFQITYTTTANSDGNL